MAGCIKDDDDDDEIKIGKDFTETVSGVELEMVYVKGGTFRMGATEEQWEYAARGGVKSKGYKYSGSNNIDEVAWYDDNSEDETHSVGKKSPNELGIYDMSGNVWEWCSDWFDDYSSDAQADPTGSSTGSYRMYRNGCWYYFAGECRVANRSGSIPGDRYDFLGFRVVCLP